jgi:hypothetical protein
MALVTREEVKTYLGETTTNFDSFIDQQILLYNSAISNYCNRVFEQADYTQTFYYSDYRDRENAKQLETYHWPLNSVASVTEIETVDGVDYPTVLEASDYRFGPTGRLMKIKCGYIDLWFTNLKHNSRIEVTYNAGYTNIPQEIKHVCFQLIEQDYNKQKSGVAQNFGDNVQRLSIPGTISIDFDYTLQANERSEKFGMFLGTYSNVLDYFRSMRILTGNLEEAYVS